MGRGFSLLGGVRVKNVQWGTANASGTLTPSARITISPVDVANTIVLYSITALDIINTLQRGGFELPDRLTFWNYLYEELQRPAVIDWCVVEFEDEVNLQYGYTEMARDETVTNVTINSVDISKSIVLSYPYASNSVIGFTAVHVRSLLTSSTNLRLTRHSAHSSSAQSGVYWIVLSFED